MAKKRIYEDHALTQTELNRRHNDNAAAIDTLMDEALAARNMRRRRKAEKSLAAWVKTYCIGLLLEDEPPPLGEKVLEQMHGALSARQNYCILMGRGSGKTSYMECAALYAVATGLQKFVVVVSANQVAANNILSDIFRAVAEKDTPFATDYPEICLPFALCNGSYHRKQTYKGKTVDIGKTASQLVFGRLQDSKGKELPTSGSLIACRGVGSAIRGLKHGVLRPSLALLDDLQTSEIAANPQAVEKVWDTIRKDIMPMAGKNRLSIIQTATQILPEDLVAKVKADKAWSTTIFPSVISFPKNENLWKEYFQLWDEECLQEDISTDKHTGSLKFYKDHFAEMDEGAEVFNPQRYSEADGHISALQKLLEIQRTIGEAAFAAEYLQSPKEITTSLPITASIVNARVGDYSELEVPTENVRYVCASTDLNPSKYYTTVICVFMRDGTCRIVWHKFSQVRIRANLTEAEYYKAVYEALAALGKELKAISDKLTHPIQGWAIDCNGANWNPALDFARNSKQICGLPCCGFVGKASTQFRTRLQSRLKESVNRTLLCGDKEEQTKSGTGRKWMYFDADLYHENVQKGFLADIGNLGSITWYKGGNHGKWAAQVVAERLLYKRERSDGTTDYRWKANGPDHDALDAIGQALAAYASLGLATPTHVGKPIAKVAKRRIVRRPRIRII